VSAAIALSVADHVRRTIADQCDIDVDDVTDAGELTADFGADTLDVVAIAVALEQRFGVPIDDATVEDWITVGDVVATLAPNTQEKAVA
jgi:acyl carrier protein